MKQKKEENLLSNKTAEELLENVGEAVLEITQTAELIEKESLDDNELAARLFSILKKLKGESLLKKKKKLEIEKTFFEKLAEKIIKVLIVNNKKQKLNKNNHKEKKVSRNIINELNAAVTELNTSSRLDSDINDIKLLENALNVEQKLSKTMSKIPPYAMGFTQHLFRAFTSFMSIGGNKNFATLSTLKAGVAMESFSEASKVKFDSVSGYIDNVSTREESLVKKMQKQQKSVEIGPNDIPTTNQAKQMKDKKNAEFLSYHPEKH